MAALPKLSGFEFRSKEEINGWPLIHINFRTNPETGQPLVAKGIVAIGHVAVGVVSIGVAAFGVVTLAAFGVGVVSLASLAVGIIALGAVALGYEFAIGAAVLSAKFAFGAIGLDFYFVVWSLIFVASIAALIWGLGKVKVGRLQS